MFSETDRYRKRWRQVEQLCDVFYKRWQLEYLPALQQRTKWLKPQRNLQVGDFVVLLDPSPYRNFWHRGKVTEVFPDKKGFVRSVRLNTTKGGNLHRPIHKLALVEAAVI